MAAIWSIQLTGNSTAFVFEPIGNGHQLFEKRNRERERERNINEKKKEEKKGKEKDDV